MTSSDPGPIETSARKPRPASVAEGDWLGFGPPAAASAGASGSYYRVAALAGLAFLAIAAVAVLASHGSRQPGARSSTIDEAAPVARQDQSELSEPATRDDARAKPEAGPVITRSFEVGRGDTLMELVKDAGASAGEALLAVNALAEFYDPRRLMTGQQIEVTLRANGNRKPALEALLLRADVDHRVSVAIRNGRFEASETWLELVPLPLLIDGTISDSLFLSAERRGVPIPVIIELIRIFSFDVDFQREIREGDRFEVFFERFEDQTGSVTKYGEVLYASLTLRGKPLSLYRFKPGDDGRADYFNDAGHAARKSLMRTPMDGARLTSRYGVRKHPILGYTRMHKGVDFGARRGTPIMAAGDGVIQKAQRNGSYGKYVRIRHNSRYTTAYAHLNGYGRGVKSGGRVKQGQIIGYVGTTGRSTGPHLHYEVLVNGKQINPMSLKLPSGRKLKGTELAGFMRRRAKMRAVIDAQGSIGPLADAECNRVYPGGAARPPRLRQHCR